MVRKIDAKLDQISMDDISQTKTCRNAAQIVSQQFLGECWITSCCRISSKTFSALSNLPRLKLTNTTSCRKIQSWTFWSLNIVHIALWQNDYFANTTWRTQCWTWQKSHSIKSDSAIHTWYFMIFSNFLETMLRANRGKQTRIHLDTCHSNLRIIRERYRLATPLYGKPWSSNFQYTQRSQFAMNVYFLVESLLSGAGLTVRDRKHCQEAPENLASKLWETKSHVSP